MLNTCMTYLVLIFSFMLPLKSFAQDIGIKYYAIDSVDKELVFFDDFEKQKDNWLSSNGEPVEFSKRVFIESGVFNFKGYKKGYKAWACKVPFDYSRNFEIEFRAKVESKNSSIHNGIIFWSREHTENLVANYLYFGSTGYVEFQTADEVNSKNTKSGYTTSAISVIGFQLGGYNTYTIRHYNGVYYIFVNNNFLVLKPYVSTNGSFIGIGGNKGSLVKYDYIKMYYLR